MSLFGNSRPPSLRNLVFVQPKPAGDREGVAIHEIHAEIAEYRLAHDGIKPELLAYLAGIGAQA